MSVREFLRSEDTELALRVVIGGGIPLFLLGFLGFHREALLVMIGSTFISGIDIPAERPRKLRLMSVSLFATPLSFDAVSYFYFYPPIFFLLLALLIFVISFIAAYSFHFGEVDVMFNLVIVVALRLSVYHSSCDGIIRSALVNLACGLWYMVFSEKKDYR